MAHGTFGTAINCMDGRAQDIVTRIVKSVTGVEFVDAITEPGVDGILAERKDDAFVDYIREKARISVDKHRSKFIAVVGHDDCAGNPVDETTHRRQIEESVQLVDSWFKGKDVTVVGLWLNKDFDAEVVVGSLKHGLGKGMLIKKDSPEMLSPESLSSDKKKLKQ